ncbi:Ig-like domain-containing protein [Gracilibacillus salitolerans]|nr:Ig-like domain-containing protein [Gracilibacillus salitolerans]
MKKQFRQILTVIAIMVLLLSNANAVFADYTHDIPEAVDPGTPEYQGDENPVPNEPVTYDPSHSMLEDIYKVDKAGGDSFWMDRILERNGSEGGADLFTKGRALYMYVHDPSELGFGGGYAYREMPTGNEQDMYTIQLNDYNTSEESTSRSQYPSHWISSHTDENNILNIQQKKFITYNNVAVTILDITNNSESVVNTDVVVSSSIAKTANEHGTELTGVQKARYELTTMYPRLSGEGFTVNDEVLSKAIDLEPGETTTVKVQMGVTTREIPESTTDYERYAEYDAETAYLTQLNEYNQWWAENVPYIDIPDQNMKKMSYYRTFMSRYNYVDANIPGNDFQFPVSIEGILGYNNAIQLTQPMHMQDLKYFRDPIYSYGNWVSSGESSKYSAFQDNPGDPAHWNNTYEQWIADEAWESYKVHGGDEKILENLARYAEGDVKGQLDKYDPNNNYLVQYDWGSLTGNDADAVALNWRDRDQDRTDQSAFNYSGALAAAEIYSILGKEDKAQEMTALAENIQQSLLDVLWDDSEGENGKVFKQRDIESGELVPWKDQQNFSPFTHELVPNTDDYKQALRFYADAEQFPIMPFFTANQYDKQQAIEAGVGGTNNFSNINSTLQARLFATAIREYPSEYITPTMYRKLIEWSTWTQYIDGDNRYPDNNEFWNSYNEETGQIEYRSWIHHNILGAYNFSIIEDIAGMKPREDDMVELWPIDMGYDYFTVNNLRYHDSDLTIVWDRVDGDKHYENSPEGYSLYLDGQRVFTVDDLVHVSYDPATGDVTILDDESEASILHSEVKLDGFKEATSVTLSSNERAVDMFQKAGVDLSVETSNVENLAKGKPVQASYTSEGTAPEEVTKAKNAVDGFTVSGLPTTRGNHYAAPNPIWGTKGSDNEQEWFEVDLGEPTTFDNVKLYFYNDKHLGNYREPMYYTVQYLDGEDWVSVPYQKKSPLQANFNEVQFNSITSEKVRVSMTPYPGYAVGLKEIQVFETGIEVPVEPNKAPEVSVSIDEDYSQPMKKRFIASVEDDGQPKAFPEISWSKTSGPGEVIFDNQNVIRTVASFSEEGRYVLTVTADDGEYSTSEDIEFDIVQENMNLAQNATPSTSFISSWEDLDAINNGIDPEDSGDKNGGAYGNWGNDSETEWVQYTWEDPVVINQSDVYWWTDGGGIQMPESYTLEYMTEEGEWEHVDIIDGMGVEPDKYNTTTFEPIVTTGLRMTITRGAQWTGILEWKVFEPPVLGLYPEDVKVRVQTGEQPNLPETVQKVFDGLRQDTKVTWNDINDGQLEQSDTQFTIWGSLVSSSQMISATIYVRDESSVTINTITDQHVITKAGQEPFLPSTVEVQYNDGSMDNVNVEVTWEEIDPSQYAEEGEFTVSGEVEGTDKEALLHVTVEKAENEEPQPQPEDPEIVSTEPVEVTTEAGVEPELPDTVTGVYDDESTEQVEVGWDAVDPAEYEEPGSFEVEGTVNGTDIQAIAIVTVIEPEPELQKEMVLWYTFDEGEGTSIADSSSKDNNGDLNGEPYWIEGVQGGALQFNGENNFIDVGNSQELQPSNITVSYWIKRAGEMGKNNIFWAKPDGGWNQDGWYLTYDDGYSSFMVVDGFNRFYVDEPADEFLPLNEWTHVVATFDSDSNEASIYKNGEPQEVTIAEEDGLESITATDDPKYLGYTNPQFDDGFIQTGLDDFRIYNYAMTAEEVSTIYETGGEDPVIEETEEVLIETETGIMPELPASIEVTYNDGTTQQLEVTWDSIDPSQLEEPRSFEVVGTINGTNVEVVAQITVTAKPVLETIELSADRSDLEPGESTTLQVEGWMSDESEVDLSNATIEFSSNNNDFVAFDDNKLMLSEDTDELNAIEVTAVVTLDGAEVTSNTLMIEVNYPPVDTSELSAEIEKAEGLLENAEVGSEPGQYPESASEKLIQAVDQAKEALESNTQSRVDQAVSKLQQAITTFKESIHLPEEPVVVDIELNYQDIVLSTKEKATVKVAAQLSDGTSQDITKDAEFNIEDTNIATVNKQGKISAKQAGVTSLNVSYAGFNKEIAVMVYAPSIKIGEETPVFAGTTIEVEGTNATITLPDDLPTGTTVTINRLETEDIQHSGYEIAGDVLDVHFEYPENKSSEEPFNLTLGFDEEKYSENMVSIYYFNEEKGEWEARGGEAENGLITLSVPHFSIYGVFAQSKTDSGGPDTDLGSKDSDSLSSDNQSPVPSKDKLPGTATSIFNYMLAGVILVAIASILLFMHRRKIKS